MLAWLEDRDQPAAGVVAAQRAGQRGDLGGVVGVVVEHQHAVAAVPQLHAARHAPVAADAVPDGLGGDAEFQGGDGGAGGVQVQGRAAVRRVQVEDGVPVPVFDLPVTLGGLDVRDAVVGVRAGADADGRPGGAGGLERGEVVGVGHG